jgi:hypothetical protein
MICGASTKELSNELVHYNKSLGRRVVAVFQVEEIMCCELDGGLLVAGVIAKEHGKVEIMLGPITGLSPRFRPAVRVPTPLQLLLVGRKFRGILSSPKSGDVFLDFGRYRIQFFRQDGLVVLLIGTDAPESCDLAEDLHCSIDEQIAVFRELAGRYPWSTSSNLLH